MKHLIQQWLNNEIDDDIEYHGREFTLQYVETSGGRRFEVWEHGELIAWNDNGRDFLDVWEFIKCKQAMEDAE